MASTWDDFMGVLHQMSITFDAANINRPKDVTFTFETDKDLFHFERELRRTMGAYTDFFNGNRFEICHFTCMGYNVHLVSPEPKRNWVSYPYHPLGKVNEDG